MLTHLGPTERGDGALILGRPAPPPSPHAQISLYVGFGAVALGSLLATALGIYSAYWGGRADLLLQRGVDAWMAFPPLLTQLPRYRAREGGFSTAYAAQHYEIA